MDGWNIYDQPVKNDKIIYESIREITAGPGDNYRTSCLLNYPCFKKDYQLIAIDLSKDQAFNADPKTIHQINFKRNI